MRVALGLVVIFFVLKSNYANPITPQLSTNFLTNMLGSFRGPDKLNISQFLTSFDAPTCMKRCMPNMDHLLHIFDANNNKTAMKNLCNNLQNSTQCATVAGCSHVFMDVVANTFQFMCMENLDKISDNLECLKTESDDLQQVCESECAVQSNVIDKMSKNDANSLMNVENLCNSTSCLVRCFKDKMQGKCSIGEKNLVDTVLSAVMRGEGRGFEQVMGWIMPDACKDENLKLKIPKKIPINSDKPLNVGGVMAAMPSLIPTAPTPTVYNDAARTSVLNETTNSGDPIETALLIDGEIRTLQCRLMDWERNAVPTPDFESLARIMTAQLLPFTYPDGGNSSTDAADLPKSVAKSLPESRSTPGNLTSDGPAWRGAEADQVIPRKSAFSNSAGVCTGLAFYFALL